MTAEMSPISCYLLDDPPRSAGRVLLSRALEEFVAIEWGIGPDDLADHFGPGGLSGEDAEHVAACIRNACGAIVDLALADRLQTFARPLGGGLPVEIGRSLWEVDDPQTRFATSAFAYKEPFDAQAAQTHWIFADAADVAAMSARLCGWRPGAIEADGATAETPTPQPAGCAPPGPASGRLLRLVEVIASTGMSRSTIYAKVDRDEFPEPVRLGKRFSRWREAEVEDWIRQPR